MSEGRLGNIGPAGRRRRLTLGIVFVGVGLVAVAAVIATRVSPGWILLAFIPFWMGALGLIQARERT